MKILVINGSPLAKGNTYHFVEMVEKEVAKRCEDIKFEYVQLKEYGLEMCRGCYLCLKEGEDRCPIHDQRKALEEMMLAADGVIFASPVYVLNVSGLFKNFLDRFAYMCHRPRFHGKRAWMVSTTGALGTGLVNFIMGMSVASWGFESSGKIGCDLPKGVSDDLLAIKMQRAEKKAEGLAEKIVRQLHSNKPYKASFYKLCAFHMQRSAFGSSDPTKADYKYWKEQGWLDPDCHFYIEAKINPVLNVIAALMAKLMNKKK